MRALLIGATLLAGATLAAAPAHAAEADERAKCELSVLAFDHEWRYELRHSSLVPVVCRGDTAHEGANVLGMYVGSAVKVVYFDNLPSSVEEFRAVQAHEYGHAWYEHRLSPEQQSLYGAVRGLAGGTAQREDYADVFAWLVGDARVRGNPYGTTLPTPEQAQRICAARLVPCRTQP